MKHTVKQTIASPYRYDRDCIVCGQPGDFYENFLKYGKRYWPGTPGIWDFMCLPCGFKWRAEQLDLPRCPCGDRVTPCFDLCSKCMGCDNIDELVNEMRECIIYEDGI